MSDRDFALSLANSVEHMLEGISDRLDLLQKQADHIDAQVHEIDQFITEHRPALARALALMDPGAKVRAMLHPRKTRDTP